MSNKEKEILKEKIKNAIKISSERFIQKKKELGQQVVVSENGKIKTINPFDLSK